MKVIICLASVLCLVYSQQPCVMPISQRLSIAPNALGATQAVGSAVLDIPSLSLRLPIPGKTDPAIVRLGTMLNDAVLDWIPCSGSSFETCYRIHDGTNIYSLSLGYSTFSETDFSCVRASWTTDQDQRLSDCVELGTAHWYGGGLLHEQHWPLNMAKDMSPFKSADITQTKVDYGSVLEPYWISSDGVGVSIKFNAKDQPLHTSWNSSANDLLCVESRFKNSAYVPAVATALSLDYSICTARNVADLHKNFLQHIQPWQKPTGIPSEAIFRKPVWSTWMPYKTRVDQSSVLEFMGKISSMGFAASNIAIDDGYEAEYGDYNFDRNKFPNPAKIVAFARSLSYNVTLWTSPFVDTQARSFPEGFGKFFVSNRNDKVPAMSLWKDGFLTLVDYTNPVASQWYFDRLKALATIGIESFKFDGGESTWTPFNRQFREQSVNPDYYGQRYAEEVARQFGSGAEVRVGLHTQQLPVFVEMADKDPVAGFNNGLRSLIPSVLTSGLLGYPFIIPGMIGGNADQSGSGGPLENVLPSDRLFLRWLGANVLLPSLHFSTTPWHYDSTSSHEPSKTSLRLLALRDQHIGLFLQLAKESVGNGFPIIRPLWWINGTDGASWEVDDQFLVGDNLMVAPILDENLDNRKIYIPAGSWQDNLRNTIVSGPVHLENYGAELHEVPTFTRMA